MIYAKIRATGSYLPDKILTNFDLERMVDTSDSWITQRTGIKQRHVISGTENTVTMGVAASKQAIQAAGVLPHEIDMILVATCTPLQSFPSTACIIQNELGLAPCIAFDIQAACSGFIYALSVAKQFIVAQQVRRVLVIGSESMSKVIDWEDRATCVLFGDGAGAVIVEASEEPGILSTHLSANGAYKDILYLNNAKMYADSYLHMEGSAVFRWAVKWLGEIAIEALEVNNLDSADIDWVVPHQANIRIIQATAKKLGLPMSKVIVTVDRHANTSSASIPIALDVAIREGSIQRGQRLLLEAFGGGLTWGSALVIY